MKIRLQNTLLSIGIAAAAVVAFAPAAIAQGAYPTKPVRIVVPYPPGGSTDAITRALGQALSDEWKQPVVIDNKGGASGMIGVEQVARADHDGYTLLMSASGPQAINVSLFPKIAYDPVKDFAPIVQAAVLPLLMVAPASAPYSNVKEFIAWAQANKGKVNFCSIGPGSPSHLAGELFASMAKLDMTHIPYKGSGPALVDSIGGTCNVLFDSALSAGPHVKGGKLKLLAVSTDSRMASWPEAGTVAESGLPGFSAYTWTALFAPAGTPPEIVQKINADANRILQAPKFREKLEAQGAIAGKGSTADMGNFLKAEIAKWAVLIKDRNIKPD
ncbi:MAG: tripartite tricarboxylate transporter substrate binding protein [Variovorax sp.]|nr:MAG: tripartite tricarboxylate transporter substrate binding protein [Variovorax sp.]